jgi:hypothetical protein
MKKNFVFRVAVRDPAVALQVQSRMKKKQIAPHHGGLRVLDGPVAGCNLQ